MSEGAERAEPADGHIRVDLADGVATVQIVNPRQHNALTRAMCVALRDAMVGLEQDRDVSIVSIRGSGRTFSSGAGINDLESVVLDRQPDGSRVDHLSRADEAISSMTKPTVALVDGACMGGGWQIASACDFIVASERSVFAVTPAKIGFLYPRRGLERLVRQVGPATAKALLISAEPVSARRAEAIGLVTEVVSDEVFEARCAALLATLLARSQFSMRTMKRLIDRTVVASADLDAEWAAAWNQTLESPDMAIGVRAFVEHRSPMFTWRPAALAGTSRKRDDERSPGAP